MSGSGKDGESESPTDFNECVSKVELTKLVTDQRTYMEEKFGELMRHINNAVTRIEHVEQRPPPPPERRGPRNPREEDDDAAEFDRDADRLQRNRYGMGGNHNRGNNDPFAKAKFTMLPFAGNADPEAYLDWELAVEQKFNSHLVPAEHRVRLATSEFTGFALFWWNDLCNANAAIPQTWNVLKQRMKSRFVPPYYQRDLRLKLQSLKQGDKGVEEYYQELLIGLARCGIHEDDVDTSARFFGGLNRDIQDILDYKDWARFSQLYHLALKAEREVQGRRQHQSFRSNTGRQFQQRSEPEKPKVPVAKPPATPPTPAPSSEVSTLSNVQSQQPKKGVSPGASSSSSTNIVCHRCKGMGHVMKDCPSRRAFIATADGYVSASDVEDDLALAANLVADSDEEKEEMELEAIDSVVATAGYPSLLVQRVLSSRVGHEEAMKIQRHNLFHMFLIVKDCRVLTIIDSGSCNNLVSSDLVKKFGLTTRAHSHPYHLQWLNNSGKAKVTKSARVHFSIGSYHDHADFDVVPMEPCSLLFGRPWEYDTDAVHHGRTNTYTLMHKNKKITLLPLSPADIRKHDKELAEKSENVHVLDPPKEIKLKKGALLATTSLDAGHYLTDEPCRTMLCTHVPFSNDPMHSALHPAVTNLLQKFDGGMESRTTPIQEGEDDEDITTLDTHEPASSPSYNSSPTWTASLVRIQPTALHRNDDISLIGHPMEVFFDALET